MRQFEALLGQLVEHARAGGPLAGLGLGAAGQSHLAEQDVAELLRASGIEVRIARELAHLGFQRGAALRELAREPRQHLPVDRDAAAFHPRQHREQRTLQRLVHAHHVLGDHARLQHLGQAQRDVGVLGDVRRGLLEGHVVEGDLGFAGADHVVVVDRRVIEVTRRRARRANGRSGRRRARRTSASCPRATASRCRAPRTPAARISGSIRS